MLLNRKINEYYITIFCGIFTEENFGKYLTF